MNEYDIALMFERIELKLIEKLRKRLEKYVPKQKIENMTDEDWNLWQIECLKGLHNFKKANEKWFKTDCNDLNRATDDLLRQEYINGLNIEDKAILGQIRKGVSIPNPKPLTASFFKPSSPKINALCEEIVGKMEQVETAILRQANDLYRTTIQNAQLYRGAGAGTTWDAVDMAVGDFTKKGVFYAEYKDGKHINIGSYSEMAVRTGNKRANNIGKAEVRKEHGLHLVLVSAYAMCSPTCLPHQGKVHCDDVNNEPTQEELEKYPRLSEAVSKGLFHPNCRHGTTTWIEGSGQSIPKIDKTSKEITEAYELEQEQRYNERQIRKWKKNEELALTDTRKQQCRAKVKEWQNRNKEFCRDNNLRRDYAREKVRVK